jgi:hypothetical protein
MPVVFRQGRTTFSFYSWEGEPREPVHVHVRLGRDEAKFWLRPEVTLAYNKGLSDRDLSRFARIVRERRQEIEHRWHDHFGERPAD